VVVAAYRRIGISLPHLASAFYGVGRSVSRSQLQPGDIIVMDGGGHAGIYIGNGLMIHAPKPGRSVEVAPIWSFSAARRLV
jgi:cell wall-associated NlpC family hydrolase